MEEDQRIERAAKFLKAHKLQEPIEGSEYTLRYAYLEEVYGPLGVHEIWHGVTEEAMRELGEGLLCLDQKRDDEGEWDEGDLYCRWYRVRQGDGVFEMSASFVPPSAE